MSSPGKKGILNQANWLQIGVVGRAHGLRGHFFVSKRDRELGDDYESVIIGEDPEKGLNCKVLEQREQSSGSVLLCDAFKDREASIAYRGKPVWVRRENVQVDDDSEYLWDDLIGKEVVDEDESLVGTIVDIYNHGASDVAVVANKAGERLDIALVGDYFDMGFLAEDKKLKLVVKKEIFSDLWQKAE